MNQREKITLEKLDTRVGNLERGQEQMLTNHLPHLWQRLNLVLKFVVIGFAGLALILTIFGILITAIVV